MAAESNSFLPGRLGQMHWFLVLYMCLMVLSIMIIFSPHLLYAQNHMAPQYFRRQSGTGFFVNPEYVITNAHVVKGCTDVYIKGAVPEHKATVKVFDESADLALIQTDQAPEQFAPLRFNIDDLKPGDRVLLLGYPGLAGVEGHFSMATAQIIDAHRLPEPKGHFYISDVVKHGNSGGPVFDTSGNVIGVVVGMDIFATLDALTQQTISEKHVGVVIDLNTLKQFLFDHGIFTEWMGSNLLYTESYIEDVAKGYIVNVQCRTPISADDAKRLAAQPEPATPITYGWQRPDISYGQNPPAIPYNQQSSPANAPPPSPEGSGTRIEQGVNVYGR